MATKTEYELAVSMLTDRQRQVLLEVDTMLDSSGDDFSPEIFTKEVLAAQAQIRINMKSNEYFDQKSGKLTQ
jgi:hypothetical protein